MEQFKSWEELSDLEQAQATYWDMYKDAYGVRPRGIDISGWSKMALCLEMNYLAEVIQREEEAREERQNKAIEEAERIISVTPGN